MFVFCVCSCNDQHEVSTNATNGDRIIRKNSIDMSREAVNKRWFENKFNTPYSSLLSISGECISWGMSGQCWYRFDINANVDLAPKSEYTEIQCASIYSSFFKEYKGDKEIPKQNRLKCSKSMNENDISYWLSEKEGVKNYIWDIYEISEQRGDPLPTP